VVSSFFFSSDKFQMFWLKRKLLKATIENPQLELKTKVLSI
jgi:hypothetical protein